MSTRRGIRCADRTTAEAIQTRVDTAHDLPRCERLAGNLSGFVEACDCVAEGSPVATCPYASRHYTAVVDLHYGGAVFIVDESDALTMAELSPAEEASVSDVAKSEIRAKADPWWVEYAAYVKLFMDPEVTRDTSTWTSRVGGHVYTLVNSPGSRTVMGRSILDLNGSTQYGTGPTLTAILGSGGTYRIRAAVTVDAWTGTTGSGAPATWCTRLTGVLAQNIHSTGIFTWHFASGAIRNATSPDVPQLNSLTFTDGKWDGDSIHSSALGMQPETPLSWSVQPSNYGATTSIGVNTAGAAYLDGGLGDIIVTSADAPHEMHEAITDYFLNKYRAFSPVNAWGFVGNGQSNMQGTDTDVSSYGSPWPAADTTAALRRWTGSGWTTNTEPAMFIGGGLSSTMIDQIKRTTSATSVQFIHHVQGSTAIENFVKGGPRYDIFLERIKLARRQGCDIKAIVYYQGEADANPGQSTGYEGQLTGYIADLRADLGSPNLPWVVVQIYNYPPGTAPDLIAVRTAQANIAANVANVIMVEATGTLLGDNLHLNSPSLRDLGIEVADAYVAEWV